MLQAEAELEEVHVQTSEHLDRIKELAGEVLSQSGQMPAVRPRKKDTDASS